MTTTVFASRPGAEFHWSAALLEASWSRVGQPGDLCRLVGVGLEDELPRSRHAQLVATLPNSSVGLPSEGADAEILPAGILDWIFRRRPSGAVLICEASSVFRQAIEEEVAPGKVVASPWPDLPLPGSGPFGLGEELDYLRRVCADQSLKIPAVTLPALVHAGDLLRLAPRWLELTSLLGRRCPDWSGWPEQTHRLAFAVALAEWKLEVEARTLTLDVQENARVLPRRCDGVREARVLDHRILDIPGLEGTISLNSSSASIWDLVDGERSVADIARELEKRFDQAPGRLEGDIEMALVGLLESGAVELADVAGVKETAQVE